MDPDQTVATDPWAQLYAPGVRRHLDYPRQSVLDAFEDAATRLPGRACTDFLGRTKTFADVQAEALSVAAGLAALGVRRGDRVAIGLPTCPQSLVGLIACFHLGAEVVLYNPLYTAEELVPQFADHGARVAVVWDKAVAAALQVAEQTPLERVVEVDLTREMPLRQQLMLRLPVAKAKAARAKLTTGAHDARTVTWASVHGDGATVTADHTPSADDVAVILYTSGTTGRAKGVMLTHANLLANCRQGVEWAGLRFGHEVFLGVLPMFHALGLTIGALVAVINGCPVVMLPAPEPGLVVEAIARRRPTFVTGVPPLFEAILKRAQKDGVSLHGIHTGLSGAMALDPEFVSLWEDATGGRLIEGYGLTEGSPIVAGNPISDSRRPGAIGLPFPDTDARVVDPDDPRRDVAPGEQGELLVRGPQLFAGYLNLPEETAAVLVDGWFRTGDLVRIEDGFLVVTGRLKELIITGGFNVSPVEVERVLRTHPAIEDVCVVGLPSHAGEDLVAAVITEHELPPVDKLRSWAKQHLAAYKVPHRFETVESFPVNAMGKVQRNELVAQLADHS